MKNKLKRIFAVGLAIVCLTVTASAHMSMDEKGVITVSGELGKENAEKMFSLDVYRGTDENGKKLSELSPEQYLTYIVCHTQLMTDENGAYEYSFKISGESGYLTAQVALEGDSEPVRESGFYYVNTKEYEKAVEAFNGAKTADEMLDCITEYGECLGFPAEEYGKLSKQIDCAEILLSMQDICGDDKGERIGFYNTAVYIQKLNENKGENVFSELEYSRLNESAVKDLYDAEFITENMEKDMTKRLSGEGFKTYGAYMDGICEAFVLATVRYPNGYDNIKTVLAELENETGISESLLTSANCKKVAGQNYESYQSLEEALKKQKTSSNSGGGGGGGYSGSVKAPEIIVDGEIVHSQTVQEINRDLFDDIESVPWAKEAIIALAEKGIVNGKEEGKFFPDDKITREEFVKIIVEAFSLESTDAETRFDDVDADAWYAPYIEIAVGNGIVKGISENSFGAGRSITREDIATIIYRIAKADGLFEASEEEELFDDNGDISDYAKEAVYALRENGIISGDGSGRFMPKDYASRAEAAKIVYGLISLK